MANDNYQQPSMFTDEEMNNIASEPQVKYGSGPVKVLGMTFPDDEERRRYFREELRKRLPELRKIEGFPIGEDDDIIALSDPPFYTACPNPWLNDFIAEWELEKKQLETEGKRSADFEVKEPYSADVSEGKNNPIYMAHAYHTKVPHPAIMRYILHYTQPGDIVFDGFAGTGMTGVAANMCSNPAMVSTIVGEAKNAGKRHAICSDLSPIATLIAASYNLPFNSDRFVRKASEIIQQVEEELGWMYETEINGKKAKINYTIWSDVFICPSCGKEINLWKESVDLKANVIHSSFPCPHCGFTCSKKNMDKAWETSFDSILNETVTLNKKVPVRINYTLAGRAEKDISPFDLKLIESIDYENRQDYKTIKLIEGYNTSQPIRSNGITYSHQFYTKRNYIILSRICNLILANNLPLVWLTSALQNASKMYKFRTDRKGGILNGTLFIPSLNIEQNPINLLKAKIRDFAASAYPGRGNTIISLLSATKLSAIKDNSLDYMFIDPPFGANIMYSELSTIWEGWLGVSTNNEEEAIVNEYQQKNLFDYQTLMNCSLKEFYRILKPGKWLTMEFSNTSAAVWNTIQNALQGVGFVVASVSALDKKQGSFKAVTTTTAVKQDLIISCFKPTAAMLERFESLGDAPENAWAFIEMVLTHLDTTIVRNGELQIMPERTPRILFDKLIAHYVAHGYAVPMNSQEFQKELHARFIERDGMYFTPDQALEYEEQKKKTPVGAETSLFVSSEREGIEWLRRELIKPQTYAELTTKWMSQLQTPKKGDAIPELMDILKENFIKEDDGRWVIPDFENQAHLTEMRNKRLRKQFGLFVEQAGKARRLKDTNLEALRFGFTECYKQKDFATIVKVAEKLPESLLMEDEVLLQFYDIAVSHV